jgi:hypothetical protein
LEVYDRRDDGHRNRECDGSDPPDVVYGCFRAVTLHCRVRIADRSGGGGKASMPSFRRRRLGAVPIAVEVAKQSPAAGDNQRATRASERPNNPRAASSRLNVHRGDSTPRYSQQPDAQGGNADPLAHAVILAGSVEQRPNERNPGHSAFSVNPGNQ